MSACVKSAASGMIRERADHINCISDSFLSLLEFTMREQSYHQALSRLRAMQYCTRALLLRSDLQHIHYGRSWLGMFSINARLHSDLKGPCYEFGRLGLQ